MKGFVNLLLKLGFEKSENQIEYIEEIVDLKTKEKAKLIFKDLEVLENLIHDCIQNKSNLLLVKRKLIFNTKKDINLI